MITLVKVQQTCSANPSMWDAWDDKGDRYCLRYQWGTGLLFNSEGQMVAKFKAGNDFDGAISLDDFVKAFDGCYLQLRDNLGGPVDGLQKGKTYEFLREGTIYTYTWDRNDAPTTSSTQVPAGTQFTVLESYWMPPGSDVFPEVRITTDAQLRWHPSEVKRMLSVGIALLDLGHVREVTPAENDSTGDAGPFDTERGKHELDAEAEKQADADRNAGIVHTDEGATYTPWTDGWAVGFHVTAPGKPDRWLLLNPSTSDSLIESNAFIYLESHEPTTLEPPDQPVCFVTIWE